jgi:hypothetical protein
MIPAHPPSEITASRYASREWARIPRPSVTEMQSKAALFRSLDSEKQRQNTKTETITNHHKAQFSSFHSIGSDLEDVSWEHQQQMNMSRACQLTRSALLQH